MFTLAVRMSRPDAGKWTRLRGISHRREVTSAREQPVLVFKPREQPALTETVIAHKVSSVRIGKVHENTACVDCRL